MDRARLSLGRRDYIKVTVGFEKLGAATGATPVTRWAVTLILGMRVTARDEGALLEGEA
jgi:hypothetical protein